MHAGVSEILAWAALVWAALLAWLAIGALLRRRQLALRLDRTLARTSLERPRVLLLRPCAGEDPGLLDNLLSVAQLGGSLVQRSALTVVMAVDDPQDRALPTLLAVQERLRALGIASAVEVVPNRAPNRKASILAGLIERHGSDHDVIINVDSNVDLAGFDLDRLLVPLLGRERVGVSWAPWAEPEPSEPRLGARASAAVLGGSLTAFPLLCALYPDGLVGKVWAARRDALADIGEFIALADYLGEDLELARRMRAAGWRISPANVCARARAGQPRLSAVIDRVGRWMLVTRTQRPTLMWTYPIFFFATPIVMGIAALGAVARPDLAIGAISLAIAARLLVALTAAYWARRPLGLGSALTDALLADLVLTLAWLRAMSSREVGWRGHRLQITRDGRLRVLPSEHESRINQ